MKYPKINSIWKRDTKNKNVIVPGEFSLPEFDAIKNWLCTEKIDGTNIRITFDAGVIRFDGRTDNSQIPADLVNYLKDNFTSELLRSVFPGSAEGEPVTLFCEGYGAGIQKIGKYYSETQRVILFDVVVGQYWLKRVDVEDVAEKLKIPVVPIVPCVSLDSIVDEVSHGIPSALGDVQAEGVVVRSQPQMLFRDTRTPIMWKLKTVDYTKLNVRR